MIFFSKDIHAKFFYLFSFTFERVVSFKRNFHLLQTFFTVTNVNNKTGNIFFCLFEMHGEVDGTVLNVDAEFKTV